VLLCGASPRLADALTGPVTAGSLLTRDTLVEAVSVAARTPPPRRMRRWLAGNPQASARTRGILREACRLWRLDHLADRAATIGTELVANAVLHADTDLLLTVAELDGYLYIGVRDGCAQRARLGGTAVQRGEPGRGLMVVEALAAAWGDTPTSVGKLVWATLPTGPPPAR